MKLQASASEETKDEIYSLKKNPLKLKEEIKTISLWKIFIHKLSTSTTPSSCQMPWKQKI